MSTTAEQVTNEKTTTEAQSRKPATKKKTKKKTTKKKVATKKSSAAEKGAKKKVTNKKTSPKKKTPPKKKGVINGKSNPGKSNTGKGRVRRRAAPSRTFPFTQEIVSINHAVVQSIYDRFFDRYRTAFYHVMAALQRHRLNAGIDQVHGYLGEMIDNSEKDLSNAKERLLISIESKTGSKNYSATSPTPDSRKAEVPSHVVRRYLDLIMKCDDFCDVIVYAESVGALSWNDRRTLMQNCQRYVTKVGGRFQSLAQRIGAKEFKNSGNVSKALDAILGSVRGLDPVAKGRPLTAKEGGAAANSNGAAGPVSKPDNDKPAWEFQ